MGNPFEGDPDFQYLARDQKKMLEEQNKPFDAKTSCWIPDQKEGYLKAQITATKGEEVTVLTENNEVCSVSLHAIFEESHHQMVGSFIIVHHGQTEMQRVGPTGKDLQEGSDPADEPSQVLHE